MALESGTYIKDLVSTNPLGTDAISQGDDHVRLIKSVLQNSFPSTNNAPIILLFQIFLAMVTNIYK